MISKREKTRNTDEKECKKIMKHHEKGENDNKERKKNNEN